MPDRIDILASTHIDKEKWNHCISNNANGLIYSTTDYLDAMAENWHGIVINDYQTIMPLPWKKKLGIRYAYTPPFIQQLGITGDVAGIDLQKILSAIHHFVSFADIHFNFSNTAIREVTHAVPRTNLVINLSQPHETIYATYKSGLKESIKKAGAQNLHYAKGSIDNAVNLYRSGYSDRMEHVKATDYLNFSRLCTTLEPGGQCIVRSVTNDNGQLLSTTLLLKDQKRLYNLMNATTGEGRSAEANHFLLDRILQEFSAQPLIFDFEGSELPGVQAFYKKFGAVNQPYFHYRYNGLPWPLRLFKR
jgi:hypothetical protein